MQVIPMDPNLCSSVGGTGAIPDAYLPKPGTFASSSRWRIVKGAIAGGGKGGAAGMSASDMSEMDPELPGSAGYRPARSRRPAPVPSRRVCLAKPRDDPYVISILWRVCLAEPQADLPVISITWRVWRRRRESRRSRFMILHVCGGRNEGCYGS